MTASNITCILPAASDTLDNSGIGSTVLTLEYFVLYRRSRPAISGSAATSSNQNFLLSLHFVTLSLILCNRIRYVLAKFLPCHMYVYAPNRLIHLGRGIMLRVNFSHCNLLSLTFRIKGNNISFSNLD